MTSKKGGRPPKRASEKLSRSINLKLTDNDYNFIKGRAEKVSLTPTEYVRLMALKGAVKSRFTPEEIDLLRKTAGISNNVNQIAKGINSDQMSWQLDAMMIIMELKRLMYDSKKH